MYRQTAFFVAALLFCFDLLISITSKSASAQTGGFTVNFRDVPVMQPKRLKIGVFISTTSGLYPLGCTGEKAGQLTISGNDAMAFKIVVEEDKVSNQTFGRDETRSVTIEFTPQHTGLHQATMTLEITAIPKQFTGSFRFDPCTLRGIGIEAQGKEGNIAKPKKTVNVFIGGFFDGTFSPVKGYYNNYKSRYQNPLYYTWDQKSDVMAYIKSLPEGSIINLIGHSWGGDTAALIAVRCGVPINILVTIDPVSKVGIGSIFGPSYADVKAHAKVWIDVNAIGKGLGEGNAFAGIGGAGVENRVIHRARYDQQSFLRLPPPRQHDKPHRGARHDHRGRPCLCPNLATSPVCVQHPTRSPIEAPVRHAQRREQAEQGNSPVRPFLYLFSLVLQAITCKSAGLAHFLQLGSVTASVAYPP